TSREASFIMNFFYFFHYFALVWWMERDNLSRVLRVKSRAIVFAIFVGLGGAYGVWAEMVDPDTRWALALVSVVSIMHFWYDGFIWSVRKKQV
ncbi:MAG: hypothetical protein KC800_34665, partial [Candidatus Eremiobacteraeota bacterium]|nr:hypothetical protein [Candidatus Eremiobacteraeota bacterium]